MKHIINLSFILFLFSTSVSGYISSDHISSDFTASYLQLIGSDGTFLFSRNKTFKAAIFNPDNQQTSFYLCIIHAASNTIIWSANRDAPISDSDKMKLTDEGIQIFDKNGNSVWSTPQLKSQVKKLSLTEMGNLVLLDQFNNSLWESFQHPTDTIVTGQRLSVGSSLSSASSSSNFSTGNYKLTITSSDAILQWFGQTYWKLSVDSKAYRISHDDAQYMTVNTTGFYIFGHNETVLVYQVGLSVTNFRIAKLAYNGQFTISSFSGESLKHEFVGPNDGCQIPLACGRLGLCNDNSSPGCSCPSNFHVASGNSGGCVPNDGSRSFSVACSNSTTNNHSHDQSNSSVVSFLSIGYGVKNSSGSCYMIENELGSINNGGEGDMLGLIKTNVRFDVDNEESSQKDGFPVIAAVLLPIVGMILLMVLVIFVIWRKFRKSKKKEVKLGKQMSISHSSSNLDSDPTFSIPGLPTRNSSNSSTTELVYFPLYALEMHEQKSYMDLADPRLEGRVTIDEVEKLVRIALCCVHEDPALRPNMVTVVGMLEGGTPLPQPRMDSLNFLRFYGRRFSEASVINEEDEHGSARIQQPRNSTRLVSGFSYISSQQISGPR
ncbi:hypothetical protein TSUD_149600 [Trifolium subterraneum]|uniref:Bulb-type lectin domain-containing protein n=1 Tax=Trifolium subterraneum TaxID=3900 RepID=A0A2Z6NSY9_TRISU|nr:hypothetical protein TSUD_149600 [Trifolium subterraneum]